MSVDALINNLYKLIESDGSVKTTELSNEILETLKTIENCTSCKGKCNLDEFRKLTNEIESCLAELEEYYEQDYIIYKLNDKLFEINIRLNKEILSGGCKIEIKKLTD